MGQNVREYRPLLPSKLQTGTQIESAPPGPIKTFQPLPATACHAHLPPTVGMWPCVGSAHVACQQHKLGLHGQAGWGRGGHCPGLGAARVRTCPLVHGEPHPHSSKAAGTTRSQRDPQQGLLPPALQGRLGTGEATDLSSPQLCSWHLGQLRLGKSRAFQRSCSPGGCTGGRESEGLGGTAGKSLHIRAQVPI